eukprot:CAMPEP_0197548544 /NCGR_PEP_ID=MMETSP1320-20131121/2650_1 /TAXON_ID=91990 /ORGANISM="Bolidomonas sp., Strain RCC2347" /LENGTH=129 /DNA_ID=CAMNT_0043108579 /DNA_START=12 /DNA_END=398 /DNA_ORIENTATION=+
MKVFKNGALVDTETDGHEPNFLTRTQHWLGRSAWSHDGYFDGTIGYLKMWHGVELTASDASSLYLATLKRGSHFWDFRGCSGASLVDSVEGSSLAATFMNGATCSAEGIILDGNNDYVDIDDWEWGGAT